MMPNVKFFSLYFPPCRKGASTVTSPFHCLQQAGKPVGDTTVELYSMPI